MIGYPRNVDHCARKWASEWVWVLAVPRFHRECRPLLMAMTPFLITAIHVRGNNYATTRVVTRLAFLSYYSGRSRSAHAVRARICFRGRCAPNWQDNYRCAGCTRREARVSAHVGTTDAYLAHSLGIIKAIYQLCSPEGCARTIRWTRSSSTSRNGIFVRRHSNARVNNVRTCRAIVNAQNQRS